MTRATETQIEQALTDLRGTLEAACQETGYDLNGGLSETDTELWHLQRSLANFETSLRAINPANLTWFQNNTINHAIKRLPRLGQRAALLILSGNTEAAKRVFWNLPEGWVNDIKYAQARKGAKLKLQNLTTPTIADTAKPIKKNLPFPKLRPINHRLDAALSQLETSWHAANQIKTLTDEDRYLLTHTVTTYLPDAWRMYTNLDGMPANVTSQAADLLYTTVTTLTSRIQTIRTAQADATLKELRAHTDFIKTKQPTPQNPNLNLR